MTRVALIDDHESVRLGLEAACARAQKVVVFSFENRTWSSVGGTQFQGMPYLNSLAKQCSTFADYTEADTSQNSASQYVAQMIGSTNHTVLNDCSPSATCQARRKTAIGPQAS